MSRKQILSPITTGPSRSQTATPLKISSTRTGSKHGQRQAAQHWSSTPWLRSTAWTVFRQSSRIRRPGVTRWIRVGTETTPRTYTSATYNAANHTVTFGGVSGNVTASQPIYPATQTAAAQTIYPEGFSSSSQILRINSTPNSTALADFPKNRGVIALVISGITYTIAYDAVVSDSTGAYFIGLHNVPSPTLKPIEASGRAVLANSMVVLGKHAEIKSKGIAGTEGGGFSAERMLHYDQSLVKVDTWKKTTLAMKGAALAAGKTDLVGTSAHDATVGALKVTGAVNAVSFMEEGVKGPLVTEYVSGIAVPQLQTIWANSGNTLSYDLQVKMRFSAGDENITGTSTKTPGSYMPGIAFRLTGSTVTTIKYYGLSVMRGIQGSTGSPAIDRDGISDYLFKSWGPNSGATAPNSTQLACLRQSNADFTWTTWSSTPPKDGRPYIILWQRDVVTNEEGGWGSSWEQQEAQMDWLAYKEACTEETTHALPLRNGKHRAAVRLYSPGWYDGVIPGTTAPTGGNVLTAIRLVDQSNILATTVKEGVTILGAQANECNQLSRNGCRLSVIGTVRNPQRNRPPHAAHVRHHNRRTNLREPSRGLYLPGNRRNGSADARLPQEQQLPHLSQGVDHPHGPALRGQGRLRLRRLPGRQGQRASGLLWRSGRPGAAFGTDLRRPEKHLPPRRAPGDDPLAGRRQFPDVTVWNERVPASSTSNFSSKVVTANSGTGWGPSGSWGSSYNKKLEDRAYDGATYADASQRDWPTVYTDWYKSPSSGTLSQFELGLHAMGIDAPNDRAFFDDFAMNMYEKTATGLLPGLRSE